jgi:hypothetical protein
MPAKRKSAARKPATVARKKFVVIDQNYGDAVFVEGTVTDALAELDQMIEDRDYDVDYCNAGDLKIFEVSKQIDFIARDKGVQLELL